MVSDDDAENLVFDEIGSDAEDSAEDSEFERATKASKKAVKSK